MILRRILNYRTYYFYIEIDNVLEEMVKDFDLAYEQSKDDKTQLVIKIPLDQDNFNKLLKDISFHNTNANEISSYLLTPEFGECTTKVTFTKDNVDYISFY